MTADLRTWRVGIVGVNHVGLFLLERVNRASNIRVVGAFDHDPSRRCLVSQAGCELWNDPDSAFQASDVDVVLLMGSASADAIAVALRHGQHVVIDQPWLLTTGELRSLHEQSEAVRCGANIATVRRWSSDFTTSMLAKQTGRLGELRSVRLSVCEQCLPNEERSTGLLREIGFPWFDQLLVLVESTPRHVFARRFYDADQTTEIGFLASIEFASGCVAQLEIRTRTRLSHQTGWMLEGVDGSYRGERLLTTTSDGEIVDEPLGCPDISHDALLEELISAWQGHRSMLPTLADAARVVQLIEILERSADSESTVYL